jgi:hypothetical protein
VRKPAPHERTVHSLSVFVRTALRREIVRRAVFTSLVVGTILAAINHGLEILRLEIDADRLCPIGLTYLVPYCVATYSATMQELRPRTGEARPEDAV